MDTPEIMLQKMEGFLEQDDPEGAKSFIQGAEPTSQKRGKRVPIET